MLVKDLIRRRSRLVKSAWIAAIERRNLEHAAAVHVTSSTEAAELDRFGWRLRQIVSIPNGVESGAAGVSGDPSGDIAEIVAAQPLVLFLGRLSWVKALDRLVQAFARTTRGTLAIVGTDEDGMAPRLETIARDLGIAARVRLLPRTVGGRDKQALLAAARLFVLASHSESFGNSILEAMQQGLPVVVTRGVGAAEVVREADSGLVVDADAGEIGQAIERLIADPALSRQMGEAGRRHVEERYAWSSVAAQMEALYHRLPAAAWQRRPETDAIGQGR
jgi:glycosyltransferase involved in cell wall biosynthesis